MKNETRLEQIVSYLLACDLKNQIINMKETKKKILNMLQTLPDLTSEETLEFGQMLSRIEARTEIDLDFLSRLVWAPADLENIENLNVEKPSCMQVEVSRDSKSSGKKKADG